MTVHTGTGDGADCQCRYQCHQCNQTKFVAMFHLPSPTLSHCPDCVKKEPQAQLIIVKVIVYIFVKSRLIARSDALGFWRFASVCSPLGSLRMKKRLVCLTL
jgi:hypothetical protein